MKKIIKKNYLSFLEESIEYYDFKNITVKDKKYFDLYLKFNNINVIIYCQYDIFYYTIVFPDIDLDCKHFNVFKYSKLGRKIKKIIELLHDKHLKQEFDKLNNNLLNYYKNKIKEIECGFINK